MVEQPAVSASAPSKTAVQSFPVMSETVSEQSQRIASMAYAPISALALGVGAPLCNAALRSDALNRR
jgi:hypothetical protein